MTLLASSFAALESILRDALDSPFGLAVEIESPTPIANRTKVAEQRLYQLTRQNAEFRKLYICLSPDEPDTVLWIMRKDKLGDRAKEWLDHEEQRFEDEQIQALDLDSI